MAQKHLKIICVMVASLNGKTTNGTDPHIYQWTSKEDQEHFFNLIEHAQLILMGRKTYEQAKNIMQHKEGRLRLVFTSHPEDFERETIPNQLEFSSETPQEIIQKLSERGYSQALLLGGSETNSSFLKENFIDELWLTVEPLVFPAGTSLFTESARERKWELLSAEKLNSQGTLLLKYKVG